MSKVVAGSGGEGRGEGRGPVTSGPAAHLDSCRVYTLRFAVFHHILALRHSHFWFALSCGKYGPSNANLDIGGAGKLLDIHQTAL